MCSPEITARVVASMAPADRAGGSAARNRTASAKDRETVRPGYSRIVDLTHPLPTTFPTPNDENDLELEVLRDFGTDRVNINRWHLFEHVGTHIDAPIHFSEDGISAEQIPIENLVVPLAVVDIRERADEDYDAELTPDDIAAWEAKHGPLPQDSCVAMNSGWDRFAIDRRYLNIDDNGVMHFPGFHAETVEMLAKRQVLGLGVDTRSLDHGPSSEYRGHRTWLPAGGWIAEGLANLSEVPPVGSTIVVGGPTIVGATGGPSRIMALV